MPKFIKIILFLLFAFLASEMSNYSFAVQSTDNSSYVSECAGKKQDCFNNPQLPYWPAAELVAGLQTQQMSMSRIQRIQLGQYFISLKSWILDMSDRKASLTQHQSRLYTTTFSYFCYPVSEYYVFALRRIII